MFNFTFLLSSSKFKTTYLALRNQSCSFKLCCLYIFRVQWLKVTLSNGYSKSTVEWIIVLYKVGQAQEPVDYNLQESWTNASKKQREKLLELIRRLAEDDKEGIMAHKVSIFLSSPQK